MQQLTNEGNILTLVLKDYPIGLNAKTMCRFLLHFYTKKLYNWLGVPYFNLFSAFAIGLTFYIIYAFSSEGNKLGTSYVLSKLLMS